MTPGQFVALLVLVGCPVALVYWFVTGALFPDRPPR